LDCWLFGILFPYLPNLTMNEIFGLVLSFIILIIWSFFGRRFDKTSNHGFIDSTNLGSNT